MLRLTLFSVLLTACTAPTATTRAPATGADAASAHGYAVARDVVLRDVEGVLTERGYVVTSRGEGSVVAEHRPILGITRFITIQLESAEREVRVDATVSSNDSRPLSHENKEELEAFYLALDQRVRAEP